MSVPSERVARQAKIGRRQHSEGRNRPGRSGEERTRIPRFIPEPSAVRFRFVITEPRARIYSRSSLPFVWVILLATEGSLAVCAARDDPAYLFTLCQRGKTY